MERDRGHEIHRDRGFDMEGDRRHDMELDRDRDRGDRDRGREIHRDRRLDMGRESRDEMDNRDKQRSRDRGSKDKDRGSWDRHGGDDAFGTERGRDLRGQGGGSDALPRMNSVHQEPSHEMAGVWQSRAPRALGRGRDAVRPAWMTAGIEKEKEPERDRSEGRDMGRESFNRDRERSRDRGWKRERDKDRGGWNAHGSEDGFGAERGRRSYNRAQGSRSRGHRSRSRDDRDRERSRDRDWERERDRDRGGWNGHGSDDTFGAERGRDWRGQDGGSDALPEMNSVHQDPSHEMAGVRQSRAPRALGRGKDAVRPAWMTEGIEKEKKPNRNRGIGRDMGRESRHEMDFSRDRERSRGRASRDRDRGGWNGHGSDDAFGTERGRDRRGQGGAYDALPEMNSVHQEPSHEMAGVRQSRAPRALGRGRDAVRPAWMTEGTVKEKTPDRK
ncbi:unnamed protein product, partial [Chrysoparadoxa australica]